MSTRKKTDNRSVGTGFEDEMCRILFDNGFWAHNMQQNASGQPADIIAAKGAFVTLIDTKVISDDRGFPFSRIEENQRSAMKMFQRRTGQFCYFALKLPDETIWLVTLEKLDILASRGRTRATEEEIRNNTWSLEEWLESSKTWAED